MTAPYYQDDAVTIYHGDCRDILPTLPAADLLLADPPYAIGKGAAFWRRNGTAIEDDGDAGHNAAVDGWRELVVLADDAAIVEFCTASFLGERAVLDGHECSGWMPWRRFLLVKAAPPPTARPVFVSGYEPAVVSYRGKRPWFGGGYVPDRWIGLTPNRKNEAVHPVQKPIEPIHLLIGALSADNALVVDPFMGSGTTLRAAKDCGRRAIGIEIEERYCEVAVSRLAQEVLAL